MFRQQQRRQKSTLDLSIAMESDDRRLLASVNVCRRQIGDQSQYLVYAKQNVSIDYYKLAYYLHARR